MITHQERKARRANAYTNAINYIINAGQTVKVNDLYKLIGDGVFNSEQYFVRCFIDAARKDNRIHMCTAKKRGTYAAGKGIEIVIPNRKEVHNTGTRGRKPKARKATMSLMFGKNQIDYTGIPVEIEVDEATWQRCRSIPKMISDKYSDTVELYKKDEIGKKTQYLQVTDKRKFHYTANAQ